MKTVIKFILSKVYCLVYLAWKCLFDLNIIPQKKFNTKIISIGNITLGGTGKTPMIKTISTELTERNISHCIISRGYKKKIKGTVVVSNKEKILASIDQSGDEPFMLAHSLKNIPIIVGNKSEAIKIAIKKFKPKLILLDDGFQSLKIKRDCDIVLVDLSRKFHNYKLLPLGFLREPFSSLKRANLIVFTKSNHSIKNSEKVKSSVFKSINKSIEVFSSNWEGKIQKYDFEKQCFITEDFEIAAPFVACSGLGNNQLFKKMVARKYSKENNFLSFPDHHDYSVKDILNIKKTLKINNSKTLVTTKKDFYKLYHEFQNYHIYILDINHHIQDKARLIDFIK
mgnify:FL=1